ERAQTEHRLLIASLVTLGNMCDEAKLPAPEVGTRRARLHRVVTHAVEPRGLTLDALVERIAATTISVLILGETGAGKEVLAERIHRMPPRVHQPLVRLNCATLSEPLLESELFGHERGAFTGAVTTKVGLVEAAHGGTVFLDEVGELPPGVQAKLLRVLA